MEKCEILNIVYSAIVEASPGTAELLATKSRDISPDLFFVDLGLNSINYAEVANIVMDKLKLQHTLDIFTRTNRISDVVEIFYDMISIKIN